MKRYLVFAGMVYYPGGGWDDYVDCYDLLADAVERAKREGAAQYHWAQVVDTDTSEVVLQGDGGEWNDYA